MELPGENERVEQILTLTEERSKRQERAGRILDAAAELIQRWGYKKTKMDDIAKLARVPKATIYLHWKTREDLFAALLLRESVETGLEMLERINADPEGMILSNMLRHSIAVVMERPLAKALFMRDAEVLGGLLRSGRGGLGLITQQKLMVGQGVFELLRSKGLLRTDQGIERQRKMYSAIVMGFMSVNQYVPDELQLSPEEMAEMVAETIRMAMEPGGPVSSQALQEVRVIWDQYMQQIMQLLHEQLQKEMES